MSLLCLGAYLVAVLLFTALYWMSLVVGRKHDEGKGYSWVNNSLPGEGANPSSALFPPPSGLLLEDLPASGEKADNYFLGITELEASGLETTSGHRLLKVEKESANLSMRRCRGAVATLRQSGQVYARHRELFIN